MISSAISADLGRQELIQGSNEALATVTGIVDGTGSIGAAVGQVRGWGGGETECQVAFWWWEHLHWAAEQVALLCCGTL